MKKIITILAVYIYYCATGFSENPRWTIIDLTPVPARLELDVRWDASMKAIPSKVQIYKLLPNHFSAEVISNVMALCLFTKKDEANQTPDAVLFQSADSSRKLAVSFSSASIHYEIPDPHYWSTNLAEGVPEMSRLPELATNVLKQLAIPLAAVTGYFQTDKFNCSESGIYFSVNQTTVTNIEVRTVKFRRAVDRIPVVAGDAGVVDYAQHGEISTLSLTWHNLEPLKSYRTVSRKTIVNFLRQGKARQGPVPDNIGDIDWPSVRSVTIKQALPNYFAGNTNTLYPFLDLDAFVDTGHGIVRVAINCPIIDETGQ